MNLNLKPCRLVDAVDAAVRVNASRGSRSTQANKGKLMTTGLWALTMHANYFGDTLLFTGWTLASSGLAVSWTWWAVPVMTALFVFMHIPGLDEYLADRYPKEFPKYAATTAKFIPYIY